MRRQGLVIAIVCLTLLLGLANTLSLAQAPRGPAVRPKPKFGPDVFKIFFEDASKQLGAGELPGDSGPAAGGNTAVVKGGGAKTPAPTGPASSGGGGGESWSKLIPPEVVEDEIKALATAAAVSTKAKGKFKSSGFKDAQLQLTMLATLFGVAAQYDGTVRWKDQAAGLRDGLSKAGFACKEGTDASFAEAAKMATTLADLVGGGKVDVPAGNPGVLPWPNVADLSVLMRRLDVCRQGTIQPATSSKDEFTSQKEKLLHEAALLAALAKIISDPEYTDESDWRLYSSKLQAAGNQITEAIKVNDYETAKAAASEVGKNCDACHGAYR